MKHVFLFSFLYATLTAWALSQEKIDSAMISKIKEEGLYHSHVMETLSWLTDVYGPRLAWSPGYRRAAEWARKQLEALGLENAHLESWTPTGKSWTLKRFSAHVIEPQVFPLLSYPKAWSPGLKGVIEGDAILFDVATDSALATFKGKLKGKFVLLNKPGTINAHFAPQAYRESDSSLLDLANADLPPRGRRRFERSPQRRDESMITFKELELCQKEGAAALLSVSRGDGGTIFVQQAVVPNHPDTPFVSRKSAYDPKSPKILPQIQVSAEHYNRILRMMEKGQRVRLEIELEVEMAKEDSGYNIIAEIPGTDLKDEVVMIGAHFDSWHGGTGATDNGTGSAVCMEAMRVLQTIKVKPRRTIRIALWGGEEEGLIGSREYVKKTFGERSGADSAMAINLLPAAEKFSVYFNNDNGSGKVRGVYMQGNEDARPIFRAWLAPFKAMGASTLTLSNTGGTDHLSFDAVNLPAFQFIQDPIEYETRTHHATMDVYDRAQEEDLNQASVIMAAFAYNAATRDEKFPRKQLPVNVRVSEGRNQ